MGDVIEVKVAVVGVTHLKQQVLVKKSQGRRHVNLWRLPTELHMRHIHDDPTVQLIKLPHVRRKACSHGSRLKSRKLGGEEMLVLY